MTLSDDVRLVVLLDQKQNRGSDARLVEVEKGIREWGYSGFVMADSRSNPKIRAAPFLIRNELERALFVADASPKIQWEARSVK
jgi:hypothetical protein